MLDATTKITINGPHGERFLTSLAGYRAPVPRALLWLATSTQRSIEVPWVDADHVARFVDQLLGAGWIRVDAPPLLFSPRVGDHVIVCRDVLAEVGRESVGLPPTWLFVPRGGFGRLVGWRDRPGDSRAIVEMLDTAQRLVVFMSGHHTTRAQHPAALHRDQVRRAG